jgi:hypothetical protein
MEITKARLRELIIESLEEVLDPISGQAESDGWRDFNAETFGGDAGHEDKSEYWQSFEGGKYLNDYDLGWQNAQIEHDLTLESKQLDEISPRTTTGRGGWQGVFDHAKAGHEFLDSLAAKFNGQEEPEELAQATRQFELILGAAKTAIARDVAPSWASQYPEEMDKYSHRHKTSFYEAKEEK